MSAVRLREAASYLRTHATDDDAMMPQSVAIALADWLDGEYATQALMEPLANLYNAAFKSVSGKDVAVIEFGRDPAGNIRYQANTFEGALAVADAILRAVK